LARTGKIDRLTTASTSTGSIATHDFSGRIEVFSLYEVMEMLSSGRKSGQLKVVTPQAEGRCMVNRGSLVSASILRLSDGEAVIEMLSAHAGAFFFTAAPATEAKGGLDLTSLLMETVRLEDEFERIAS
jgi:hypothetical protein